MIDLWVQYEQSKKTLDELLPNVVETGDRQIVAGMVRDIEWVLQWISTGRQPGNRRGIERRSGVQRELLTDPFLLQAVMESPSYAASRHAALPDQQKMKLEAALSLLSARERECFELAHGRGFTLSQIAEFLSVSKGTVGIYVRRANKKLAALRAKTRSGADFQPCLPIATYRR